MRINSILVAKLDNLHNISQIIQFFVNKQVQNVDSQLKSDLNKGSQLSMQKKKLWLMDNLTFNEFKNYRLEKYKAIGLSDQLNDQLMTKYYTYGIIHFLRKKRIFKAEPFKVEKFIHVAVCLYKRFYLVNQYGDNNQTQNALCTIYLSLKINQFSHSDIESLAIAWKKKKDEMFFLDECTHFGQPGYTEKELHFLRGIGFQIGRSPIIICVQSLYNIFCQQYSGIHGEMRGQVEEQIFQLLRRVYTDQRALFLFEGPKIGLAVFLHAIDRKQQQYKSSLEVDQMLSEQLKAVIERNKIEIDEIIFYISKLQKFESDKVKDEFLDLKSKLIKEKKRKNFQFPEKKSPKVSPKSSDLLIDY